MKAKIVLALVFCVAAAAFFAPVVADEEEATAKLNKADDVLAGDAVESLSRDLKEADETSNADKDAVEASETELDKDPADRMMRDLQGYPYYRHHKGKGYYSKDYYYSHDTDGHYKGRRLQNSGGHYYHKKPYHYYYEADGHYKGRRLQNSGGHYYHKKPYHYYYEADGHYKGRRL